MNQESETKINKFSWYPGHIAKAERQLKEKINIIDIIVELRDARVPESSRHRDLEKWAQGKPVITVLNKADLAPKLKDYLSINSHQRSSLKDLVKEIEKASQPYIEKYKKQGIINRPTRIMIVGYPNVGKSSLINALAQKKKAKVADKAGVTRQQQWVDISNTKLNLKLLDTPGIIPTSFYSDEQALKLALCNLLGEKAFEVLLVARESIKLIDAIVPNTIATYYELEEFDAQADDALEQIAIKRGWLRNQEPDLGRAAQKILQDFRDLRFGKISLDQ